MECVICFDNIVDEITCHNIFCNTKICLQCFDKYLNLLEGNLPKCIDKKCNGLYLSSFNKMPNDVKTKYYNLCYSYLINKDNKEAIYQLNKKDIERKIREERLIYLNNTFPKAISIVAKIVCDKKLREIKSQSNIQKELESNRLCMNLYCKGLLDDQLKCLICKTEFCTKCENIMGSDHKCSETDKSSLELINKFPKCPNCNLPVDKDNGCGDVKCGKCGTNFDYYSGTLGGSGGHTEIIQIKIREKLSDIYDKYLSKEQLSMLKQIESLKPSIPTRKSLDTLIENALVDPQKSNKKELVKTMEKYYIAYHKYENYIQCMIQLEGKFKQNNIKTSELKQILFSLQ